MKAGFGTALGLLSCGLLIVGTAVRPAEAWPPGQEVSAAPVGGPEEVIRAQLDAFNAGDVDALAANVSDDFVYFSVDSDYVTPVLQGREAFRRSMEDYFLGVDSPRAEIEEIFPAGEYLAVLERAFWNQSGREVSQASLAVYEVRAGLIRRVWYYPVIP